MWNQTPPQWYFSLHCWYFQEGFSIKRTISNFGICAQHQNTQAESAIQTILYMACTFIIHTLFNFSERGIDDILMWSFSVKHTVWIHSWVASIVTGLTPMELLIQTKNYNKDLLHFHILGWPVFYFIKNCKKEIKYLSWIITHELEIFWIFLTIIIPW